MKRQAFVAASARRVRAIPAWAIGAIAVLSTIAFLSRSAASGELELHYYGADWCAPCQRVEPMVDRWAAEHPDIKFIKLDYETHKEDRLRFGLVGVPMLVLLEDDKLVGKYGHHAQRIGDFARLWLERWYDSTRDKIDAEPH
jgi:thiol-disulfide isomerase/thioredoxin